MKSISTPDTTSGHSSDNKYCLPISRADVSKINHQTLTITNMKSKFTFNSIGSILLCSLLFILALGTRNVSAQPNISTYTFAQATGTYKQAGAGASLTSSGCYDDAGFAAIALPFTFTYHGLAFT